MTGLTLVRVTTLLFGIYSAAAATALPGMSWGYVALSGLCCGVFVATLDDW